MKTPATHENQYNALRLAAIRLIDDFLKSLAERASFTEKFKVSQDDIDEWKELFVDTKRHPAHQAIIPLGIHLVVMSRILSGESYGMAMSDERRSYSGREFIAIAEKRKKRSLI